MDKEFLTDMTIMLGVYGIIAVVVLIQYILGAIGFHTMAKRRGYNKGWFAWFPILSDYLVGAIADDTAMRRGRKSGLRKAVLGLTVAATVIILLSVGALIGGAAYGSMMGNRISSDAETILMMSAVGAMVLYSVGGTLVLIQRIVLLVALGKVYCDYSSNGALMIVLTIFFPVVKPFMAFAIRKNEPKSLMPQPQPQYAPAYGAPAGYQPQQGYAQPNNGYQQYQAQPNYNQPGNGYQMQSPMPQNIPQQAIPQQNIPQQTMPEQINADINNEQ